MTYTAKDTMKKLKKVKDKPAAEKLQSNRDEESKTEDINVPEKSFTLNKAKLRTELVAESAYISEILGLVHFPKRADSDDEGVTMVKGKKKMLSKDGAQSVQELRERLRAKLESLQASKGPGSKNKKNKKLSKEEKKTKLKEELRLKSKLAKINAGTKPNKTPNGKCVTGSNAKPVYNADGKMVFSKFDLSNGGGQASKSKKPDPKSTLQSIQKQKEQLKKLELKGETSKVNQLEETSAWTKALDKAEGVKVKDDESLLKKSIKKQEQRKKSSAKKWDARKESEDKRKNAKQQKRNENISKRKKDKKDNKMKKLAKKGRVPGFR